MVLDPTRLGRDAGRVAEEVIAHLAGLPRADVRITLEIEVGCELQRPVVFARRPVRVLRGRQPTVHRISQVAISRCTGASALRIHNRRNVAPQFQPGTMRACPILGCLPTLSHHIAPKPA